MIGYRDYIINEFSFLINEYGFDKPIKKSHDNREFSFTWKKGEILFEIKWEMYQSRSAPFPEFRIIHPTIVKGFEHIIENYRGCCFKTFQRYDKVRNKMIFSSKKNDRRNNILSELFKQRVYVFKRLLKENDAYLI